MGDVWWMCGGLWSGISSEEESHMLVLGSEFHFLGLSGASFILEGCNFK